MTRDDLFYDAIGGRYGGINSKDFVQELMAMAQPTIHMRINSPGGDVFEARAIQAAMRAHSSKDNSPYRRPGGVGGVIRGAYGR